MFVVGNPAISRGRPLIVPSLAVPSTTLTQGELFQETVKETKNPDIKVHGANMGPTWGRQDPGGPHVGNMNFAIWELISGQSHLYLPYVLTHQQDVNDPTWCLVHETLAMWRIIK